jgi:Leucine-rich repeat (LRR) protein
MNRESTVKPLWEDLALRRYLSEVATRMGTVEILALDNMRDLPRIRIETIYVPPLLAAQPVNVESEPASWPPGQNLLDALEEHRRLVVLGDPGGGKTTLANWLAWRLSAGLATPLPTFLEGLVPLPCVLRELSGDVFAQETPLTGLVEPIVRRLLGDKASEELKANLRARVEAGKYLLILDGVDEIPVSARELVRNWVKAASVQEACVLVTSRIVGYDDMPVDRKDSLVGLWLNPLGTEEFPPEWRAVLGSKDFLWTTPEGQRKWPEWSEFLRIKGSRSMSPVWDSKSLEARPSPTWVTRRYLMPFDDARITAFATNWYRQRCRSEIEAGAKAADLVASLSRHAVTLHLARTPNLLTLMAVVHRERADLPDGKALLYDEIANAYINTIDSSRKLALGPDRLAHHDWKERKSWLAYVGFRMQVQRSAQDQQSGILAPESDVCGWVANGMQRAGVDEAPEAARDYLGWVARRSGLLLPRGDGIYAFVHLSFQEYFCACYLAERMLSPTFIRTGSSSDGTVSRQGLHGWAEDAVWRETLVFLFEKLSAERDPGWVDDLAETVFSDPSQASMNAPTREEPSLALAARIVGDSHVRLRESIRNELIRRCVQRAVEEWHGPWEQFSVLPLLVDTGIACIVRVADDDSLRDDQKILSYRTLADVGTLRSSTQIRLLIVRDQSFSDLSALGDLSRMLALDLAETQVDDLSSLIHMTGLTRLDLQCTQVSDLSPLAAMTGLTFLDVRETQVSDLSPLAAITGLETLLLANTLVSDLSPLAAMTGLKSLSLDHTHVRDLSPLAAMTDLAFLSAFGALAPMLALDLAETQVDALSSLVHITGLTRLDLQGTQVSDLSPLAAIKGLAFLDVRETQVSDLSPLEAITGLETLLLARTLVSDLSPLAAMTGLTSLSLDHTRVSDLSPLTEITGLTFLSVGDTQVSDLSPLAAITGLRTLSLASTLVNNLSPLAAMTGLTFLDIAETQVSDLSPLTAINGLEILSLASTLVNDLSPLAEMTDLTFLNIGETQVSDLSPLVAITGLRTLSLASSLVNDLSSLAAMTGLTFLDIAETQVSDLSPLAAISGLEILSLASTPVNDLSPLAELTGLRFLNIGETQVSDVSPLAKMTALTFLYIAETQVSDLSPLAAITGLQIEGFQESSEDVNQGGKP